MLSQIKIIPGCKIFVKINKTIGTLEPTTNNPILYKRIIIFEFTNGRYRDG